jgi:hypothetical protein
MTTVVVDAVAHLILGRHTPRKREIQYAAASRFNLQRLWNTGSPAFAGDDTDGRVMTIALRGEGVLAYAAAGTGRAVTDLIFSIAKREVTFFSGTAPISFL